MTEYVVLGAALVLMGGVQMWLRWGPWGKDLQAADEAVAKRKTEALADSSRDEEDGDDDSAAATGGATLTSAGSRLWNKWTAILGPLGISLGLFLLFWGIFAG